MNFSRGPATVPRPDDQQLAGQTINERFVAIELMLAKLVEGMLQAHQPINYVVNVSSSSPYIVDFKGRKHVFVYGTSSANLTIDTVGAFTMPAATWTNLSFEQGTRIVNDSSTFVPLYVRCTDEAVP